MAREYLRRLLTPAVRDAQRHYYGKPYPEMPGDGAREPLGPTERAFVAARDSFFMATVTEAGWPYMQHRGGPEGFLVALSPEELAFADYGGNRQLITAGSLGRDARTSLFLIDYANRARLKILGRARVFDAREHPDLVQRTEPPGGHAGTPERVVRIAVEAADWNCPQHITRRFTQQQVEAAVRTLTDPLQARIAELEAELATLRGAHGHADDRHGRRAAT